MYNSSFTVRCIQFSHRRLLWTNYTTFLDKSRYPFSVFRIIPSYYPRPENCSVMTAVSIQLPSYPTNVGRLGYNNLARKMINSSVKSATVWPSLPLIFLLQQIFDWFSCFPWIPSIIFCDNVISFVLLFHYYWMNNNLDSKWNVCLISIAIEKS